jgi:phospholipid/cholesterol/gamma-HCH transport system substrate-binding protein
MESRSNAIAAGVFVVALLVGLIGASLYLTSDSLDQVRYLVESKVPVTGLHAKAAVRLRGVDVGRVDDIVFDAKDPRVIVVTIAVDRKAPVTRGTYGQLGYQGVTGLTFISLDDDGSDLRPLPPGGKDGRIELRPSMIDTLGANGQDLLRDAALAAKRLAAVLSDDNVGHISGALRNAEHAAQEFGKLAANLQPAAKSLQALETQTQDALGHLDLLVGDMRGIAKDVGPRVSALDQVGQGAQALGNASRAVQSALVEGTLPRLNVAIDDFERTARRLDGVLTQLERRPQSLVFGSGDAPPGPGEPGFTPAPRGH